MKRILLIFASLIVLVLACVYLFIPGKVTINRSTGIHASGTAIMRKLQNVQAWKQWWPGNKKTSDSSYSLDGIKFAPGPSRVTSVPVNVAGSEFSASFELTVISHKLDSSSISVESSFPVSSNPFKRVTEYLKIKKLDNDIAEILRAINDTYSKTVNLYGWDIQKKLVIDSILVSTSAEVKGYPTIERIYGLIDELKSYVKKNDAVETGFPMLNIYSADKLNYNIKVAIPVNKRLPDSENIRYKWMLGGGNILITEVKGGQTEIDNAYEQILNYISDYGRTAPAIPFESLVTDRRQEPDSSKWITRIYYPVM